MINQFNRANCILDVINHFCLTNIVDWTYLADIRNISNMYPYGKSYPAAANYSADDDYRYGFNGMEKEKSFDSEGDVADFGARIFDANYPVFLSRDPLETSFANQSSYIFASNTPIQAIDFNGENTFFVMGTNYEPKNNSIPKLQETVNYLHKTLSTSTGEVDYGFDWSDRNGLFNGPYDRNTAGYYLAMYALKNNKEGDDITFIGYSYGGAVSVIAADFIHLWTNGKVKTNIISIATPTNNRTDNSNLLSNYKNNDSYYGRLYRDFEIRKRGNPANTQGINDMIHFYMTEDFVAGMYGHTYDSDKVSNYQLETENAPWNDNFWDFYDKWFNSHINIIYNKNIFEKTIESNNVERMEPTNSEINGEQTPNGN